MFVPNSLISYETKKNKKLIYMYYYSMAEIFKHLVKIKIYSKLPI